MTKRREKALSLDEAERRIADAAARGSDRLSLSCLGLKAMPPLPKTLRKLRGLSLSGNRLNRLCPEIEGLAELEWLDLGSNRFDALPAEVFRLTQLVSLDLSENRLSALAPEVGALSNLIELSLYRNQLSEIPAALLSLAHLKRLDLAGNRISSLPAFDGRLARLEALDLSGNALTAVPAGLDRIIALRALNLADNQITSSNGVEALDLVKELDLSANLLAQPPFEALKLTHLRVLEAEGNPFGPLPEQFHGIARHALRARAAAAVAGLITGGMEQDKRYFEPVSFVFGCVVTISGLMGVSLVMDRLYKRYKDIASVTLEFPSGTRLRLGNLSHKRALEIAREHEEELSKGIARLDLGQTTERSELALKKAFTVDVLARVPGSSLLPTSSGAVAQQFIIYNGPVYSPIMLGPSAKEEIMGDKITVSNVQNSIINVKGKLQQVAQTIEMAPIDTVKKQELKALVEQLNGALAKVPADKREDAETVAEMVKDTMDKVNQPKPNKKTLEFSLKGIVEAAKDLTEALPVAVKLAAAIAGVFGFAL